MGQLLMQIQLSQMQQNLQQTQAICKYQMWCQGKLLHNIVNIVRFLEKMRSLTLSRTEHFVRVIKSDGYKTDINLELSKLNHILSPHRVISQLILRENGQHQNYLSQNYLTRTISARTISPELSQPELSQPERATPECPNRQSEP